MKIPTSAEISRMSDADLQATYDALEAWQEAIEDDPEDEVDDEILDALLAIEREQDARELWNHPDPRVREAQGNYR